MSDTDTERTKKDKKAKTWKGVSDTLARAVAERQPRAMKEEDRKRRSRSRSKRSRKKRRRSRRRPGSRNSSENSSDDVSSSENLQPPLKKKTMKDPGSVFRMLLNQALAQEGLELEEATSSVGGRQKVRLYTFYQLGLKPALGPKSHNNKELALLAKALDLLQVAVDTATRQGRSAARLALEDDAKAPPHVLLAAMKHSRQVGKAGGKRSLSRTQSWGWGWPQESKRKRKRQRGAKGKKGKERTKEGRPIGANGAPARRRRPPRPNHRQADCIRSGVPSLAGSRASCEYRCSCGRTDDLCARANKFVCWRI